MKYNFMEIFNKLILEDASAFFDSWYENLIKSNIEPMKNMPKTLVNYKSEINNIIKYGINNAKAVRFNGAIQWLNYKAKVTETLMI